MSRLSHENFTQEFTSGDYVIRRAGQETCYWWRKEAAGQPIPLADVKQLYAAGDIKILSDNGGKTVYIMNNPPQKHLTQTEWTQAKDSFQAFANLMADEAARPALEVTPEPEPELIHVDGVNHQVVLYRKDGSEKVIAWNAFERLMDTGHVRHIETIEEQFYPGNDTFFPIDLFAFGAACLDELNRLLLSLERQFRVWQSANPHYLSGGVPNTHLTRRMARVKRTMEARHVSTK